MEPITEKCYDINKFLELWEALKDLPVESFERVRRELTRFNGKTLYENYEADNGFRGTGYIIPPYDQDGVLWCSWITPEPSRQAFCIGHSHIEFDWDGKVLNWTVHFNPHGNIRKEYRVTFMGEQPCT